MAVVVYDERCLVCRSQIPCSCISPLDSSRAFIHGLTSSQITLAEPSNIQAGDRGRLIQTYVCSSIHDGGLGITPLAPEWDRVASVFILHDQRWNDKWIKAWSTKLDVNGSLDQLRAQVRHA